jgi:hypothetical protein
MAGTPPCTVLNCSARADHVWAAHSVDRHWAVDWRVCPSHLARLLAEESWAPDYGSAPAWRRSILMGDDLALADDAPWLKPGLAIPASLPPHAEGESANEILGSPSQRHPDPDVSDAPGCMVLGCRETAHRLWAYTLSPDRITRWPVCGHHHQRLAAGEHWAPEPGTTTPASRRGWLLMGEHAERSAEAARPAVA